MPKTQESILVIENNLFLGGILADKLKKVGYDALTASNGKKGLELLTKNKVDLVVLDLPFIDISIFFGVLRELRKKNSVKPVPVIVLSNLDDEKDIIKITELGASAYLVKAYTDVDEMVEKITELVSSGLEPSAMFTNVENDEKLDKLFEKDNKKKRDDNVPTTDYDELVARNRNGKSIKPDFLPSVNTEKKLKGKIDKIALLAGSSEEDELAIVNLVEHLIEYAALAKASDIHFKPEKEHLLIRLRVDGVLRDAFKMPTNIQSEIITRIKVLSGMRTDEHQAAQDGRFKTAPLESIDKQFDVRVSIVPTYHGEDAVLRLLIEQAHIATIADIPFSDSDREKMLRSIKQPYGMILATGPTGSGKTTTLYTILKQLNTKDVSIVTIEDPIEYSLAGINQIQVNTRTELTFAKGLRSILRQDPDIIMVGEIRDKETAGIAVNAALTGHKLLSTLHTNDAVTTLPRLLDMGVEPFLIASTVNVALGQRLVRRICDKCKTKKKITPAEIKGLTGSIPAKVLKTYKEFYTPGSCDDCADGYKGRLGIYEVLEIDDEMRVAIMERKDASELKKIALKNGMKTLIEDGVAKAAQGLTTLEEILRVVRE